METAEDEENLSQYIRCILLAHHLSWNAFLRMKNGWENWMFEGCEKWSCWFLVALQNEMIDDDLDGFEHKQLQSYKTLNKIDGTTGKLLS